MSVSLELDDCRCSCYAGDEFAVGVGSGTGGVGATAGHEFAVGVGSGDTCRGNRGRGGRTCTRLGTEGPHQHSDPPRGNRPR